ILPREVLEALRAEDRRDAGKILRQHIPEAPEVRVGIHPQTRGGVERRARLRHLEERRRESKPVWMAGEGVPEEALELTQAWRRHRAPRPRERAPVPLLRRAPRTTGCG